jgi:hypothetical protein
VGAEPDRRHGEGGCPVCKVLSQVVRCIQGNYDKQYLK